MQKEMPNVKKSIREHTEYNGNTMSQLITENRSSTIYLSDGPPIWHPEDGRTDKFIKSLSINRLYSPGSLFSLSWKR